MLKFIGLFLLFIPITVQSLPPEERSSLLSRIEANTYRVMFRSFSDIELFARDPILLLHGDCASGEDGNPHPHLDRLNELENLRVDHEFIDLYLVKDGNTGSVVVAVAKLNRSEFRDLVFHYRPGQYDGAPSHHGTLKIGDNVVTEGQVQFGKTSMSLQTDNYVAQSTLYQGDIVRITNFEGFSLDTQVDIKGGVSGELQVLGISGFAIDIDSRDATALEMARLKFDFGVGANSEVSSSAPVPVIESTFKLELGF